MGKIDWARKTTSLTWQKQRKKNFQNNKQRKINESYIWEEAFERRKSYRVV